MSTAPLSDRRTLAVTMGLRGLVCTHQEDVGVGHPQQIVVDEALDVIE